MPSAQSIFRMFATTMAIALFTFGGYMANEWWRLSSQLKKAETSTCLTLENPFAKAGTYEVPLDHYFELAHSQSLCLQGDLPVQTDDDIAVLLEGLRSELVITNAAGERVAEQNLLASGFYAWRIEPRSDPLRLTIGLAFYEPAGKHQLILNVDAPAAGLADVPHQLTARYDLCGLEYVMVSTVGWFSAGGFAASAVVALFLVASAKKRRSGRGFSAPLPGS